MIDVQYAAEKKPISERSKTYFHVNLSENPQLNDWELLPAQTQTRLLYTQIYCVFIMFACALSIFVLKHGRQPKG